MTLTRHLEIGTQVTIGTVTEPIEAQIIGVWLSPSLKYDVAYWQGASRQTVFVLPCELVDAGDLD